jgi:hypothetical protein
VEMAEQFVSAVDQINLQTLLPKPQ